MILAIARSTRTYSRLRPTVHMGFPANSDKAGPSYRDDRLNRLLYTARLSHTLPTMIYVAIDGTSTTREMGCKQNEV